MLSIKQGGIRFHFFLVFGMTQPGIEPQSPEPLANTIPLGQMHSISFQAVFVQAFKIVIDSWKVSMLLLYILWEDWPIFMISGLNEQLPQQLEYTLLDKDRDECERKGEIANLIGNCFIHKVFYAIAPTKISLLCAIFVMLR